jgi:TonB family protein
MPAYPPQLVAAGIQGRVELQVTVSSEGQVKDIKVSSNQYESAALAEAAIVHARGLPYGEVVRKDAPDTVFIVPYIFTKDTEASIGSKTCADFNVDVAALRVGHPKAEVAFMNAFQIAKDILIHHQFAEDAASWPSRSPTMQDAEIVAELCAEKPEAGFMGVFRQQLMSVEP